MNHSIFLKMSFTIVIIFILFALLGATGLTEVTRATANISRVQFVKLIPKKNLTRTPKEFLSVSGLCAISNDTLLLACRKGGLRALSLDTGLLSERDPVVIGDVLRVAYEEHTDTLLLVVRVATDNWQLVSLRRNNEEEWLEVQRLSINNSITPLVEMAICGSRVLLGGESNGKSTMYVFDVSAEHNVSSSGTVALEDSEPFDKFVCTSLDGDTLVALTYEDHVCLKRLESQSLKQLARAEFRRPFKVLFFRDLLLVADSLSWYKTPILLLHASGGALAEQRVLGGIRSESQLGAWAIANDRFIYWDTSSNTAKDLIVYTFG